MPAVIALARRYEARGLRVVSTTPINRADNREEREAIAEAIREEQMPYACYLDAESSWSLRTGLRRVPSFALVGRDGVVRYRARGVLLEGNEEFRAMVDAIERELSAARRSDGGRTAR